MPTYPDSLFFNTYEASAITGFCGNDLNREALKRPDAAWFEEQWTRVDAKCLFFCGELPIMDMSGDVPSPYFPATSFDRFAGNRETTLFLGFGADERPLFGSLAGLDEEAVEAAGPYKLINLRSLAMQGFLTGADIGALAQGRSLVHWHAKHQFCANCGVATKIAEGGYRRDCDACDHKHFPRTDPVAIWLTLSGDKCLMGRSGRFADNMYSCLAGFIEPGETIEDAVRRENFEESGIRVGRVSYHASQPWPFPASLMVGCYAEALSTEIDMDEEELVDCRWFSRDEVALMQKGEHPDGLTTPPDFSIAYRIISDWVDPKNLSGT